MSLIADILLIAGALGAGLYCIVLSRRLAKLTDLEGGMGGAIAVLSVQVDDMTKLLDQAKATAAGSSSSLGQLTQRAEGVAQRLELLVAAMHDLPEPKQPAPAPAAPEAPAAAATLGSIFASNRTRPRSAAE